MTKKRFTYEYDEYNGNLFDNKMDTFYHIEDSDENIKIFCDRLNSLVDENEELKLTIKKVIELLGEEVDVFSEKATEHDLNAYKELQQLDNKDAYYMATAIKKAIKMLKGDVE